jgi:anaerobic selenocysteine-containing dehydrogenase
MCPYTYTITVNADTGRAKGLKDGDRVWLETPYGRKESGVVKLMEGQHPKSVGIAGQAGLWSESRPIAKGKGSNFNKILPCDVKHFDPITLCIETAVAVKIYKMEGN